jgi:hypothetical protein
MNSSLNKLVTRLTIHVAYQAETTAIVFERVAVKIANIVSIRHRLRSINLLILPEQYMSLAVNIKQCLLLLQEILLVGDCATNRATPVFIMES